MPKSKRSAAYYSSRRSRLREEKEERKRLARERCAESRARSRAHIEIQSTDAEVVDPPVVNNV